MSTSSLPSGCSPRDFRGPGIPPNISTSFLGCVADTPSVLQTCCSKTGSTAAFVNGTCGCPLSQTDFGPATGVFGTCVLDANATAQCGGPATGATSAVHRDGLGVGRVNLAVVVLGVAVLMHVTRSTIGL
ncbi:hypothetical protein B0H13DRAFT_2653782 [Mycena leptocephala]|nr:hypothetical protein B0H13DRAFT_2653782 [Mycena leptocephala]